MKCRACDDAGWRWVDDGNGCVAKEACDCGVFDDRVQRQANA